MVGVPRRIIQNLSKPTLYLYVSPQPEQVPIIADGHTAWCRYLINILSTISRDPLWFRQLYDSLTRYVYAQNVAQDQWIAIIKPLWSKILPVVCDPRRVQQALLLPTPPQVNQQPLESIARSGTSHPADSTTYDVCVYRLATLAYPMICETDSKTPSPLFFKPKRVAMSQLREHSKDLQLSWSDVQTHLLSLEYLDVRVRACFIYRTLIDFHNFILLLASLGCFCFPRTIG